MLRKARDDERSKEFRQHSSATALTIIQNLMFDKYGHNSNANNQCHNYIRCSPLHANFLLFKSHACNAVINYQWFKPRR